MDENNILHTACERERTGSTFYISRIGFDFWNGPVADTQWYTMDYQIENDRVWKLSKEEINNHIEHFNEPGYIMPESIANWPAHCDHAYTGVAAVLAPFADLNGDGIYNPISGDSPRIKGDQEIYSIFNDDYGLHVETEGRKLGIEIHGLAYVFDCPGDSAFNNSVFVDYKIINRSNTGYHDIYIGNYTNFKLGNPTDDYLGCDTVLNGFYAYNADDFDDTSSTYNPGYGEHPPAQGVLFLNCRMDHFMFSKLHAYPSTIDTNYFADPWKDTEHYNYMNSRWPDNTHLNYGGGGYGTGSPVNYVFSGDPVSGQGWIQANAGIPGGGMHGIASSGPYNLPPGDTLELELSYVFARDYNGTNLTSVDLLKDRIERIKWFYDNDSTPCGSGWSEINDNYIDREKLIIRPNPLNDMLYFELPTKSENPAYRIFDLTGRELQCGTLKMDHAINCRKLSSGYYILQIQNHDAIYSAKFIKK